MQCATEYTNTHTHLSTPCVHRRVRYGNQSKVIVLTILSNERNNNNEKTYYSIHMRASIYALHTKHIINTFLCECIHLAFCHFLPACCCCCWWSCCCFMYYYDVWFLGSSRTVFSSASSFVLFVVCSFIRFLIPHFMRAHICVWQRVSFYVCIFVEFRVFAFFSLSYSFSLQMLSVCKG